MLIQQEANAARFDLRSADNDEPVLTVATLQRALDTIGNGMLIVSALGRIAYMNEAARRVIAVRDNQGRRLLRSDCGELHACEAGNDARLAAAIDRAIGDGLQSLVHLRGDAGSSNAATYLSVSPLGEFGRTCKMAVVALARTDLCDPLTIYLLGREMGLTEAECSVLQLMCEGLSTKAIAKRRGESITVNTILSQVAAIRAKTGCKCKLAVLRLIALMPGLFHLAFDQTAKRAA
jgi:DNA-binding CsgD family transcriptional regulator